MINGGSDLLVQIFGDTGRNTRTAVSANELPFNIPAEVEIIVEVTP